MVGSNQPRSCRTTYGIDEVKSEDVSRTTQGTFANTAWRLGGSMLQRTLRKLSWETEEGERTCGLRACLGRPTRDDSVVAFRVKTADCLNSLSAC